MGAVLSVSARVVRSVLPCWWVSGRGAFGSPFLLFLLPVDGFCFLPSCFSWIFLPLLCSLRVLSLRVFRRGWGLAPGFSNFSSLFTRLFVGLSENLSCLLVRESLNSS